MAYSTELIWVFEVCQQNLCQLSIGLTSRIRKFDNIFSLLFSTFGVINSIVLVNREVGKKNEHQLMISGWKTECFYDWIYRKTVMNWSHLVKLVAGIHKDIWAATYNCFHYQIFSGLINQLIGLYAKMTKNLPTQQHILILWFTGYHITGIMQTFSCIFLRFQLVN